MTAANMRTTTIRGVPVYMAQNMRGDVTNHATTDDTKTVCGRRIKGDYWTTYDDVTETRLRDAVDCIACRIKIGTLAADWADHAEELR